MVGNDRAFTDMKQNSIYVTAAAPTEITMPLCQVSASESLKPKWKRQTEAVLQVGNGTLTDKRTDSIWNGKLGPESYGISVCYSHLNTFMHKS